MSGHSKWSTIKRAKGINDAKRGAIFTKLANVITVAVKEKGGDLDTNFTLRMAIDKAKQANMPKDNIERAIKRGTGELEGDQILELYYEGIGPANAQFIVKSLTDNKNRSAAEIRHVFTKYGGSFGAVMWNFGKKGVVRIVRESWDEATSAIDADELELELIDNGAQDVLIEEEGVTIYTDIPDIQKAKNFLEEKNIKVESAEIEFIAKEEKKLEGEDREKIEKFIDTLEECDEATDYYTNISI